MENKVIIGDGRAYEDVTVATARFIVGERQKRLKACWLTHLNIQVLGQNTLPRGEFRLRYGSAGLYPIAMRATLTRRFAMPIVPLATKRWTDFGCGLFLMDDSEEAIGREEYKELVLALQEYGVERVVILPDICKRQYNWLIHEKDFTMDDWDFV